MLRMSMQLEAGINWGGDVFKNWELTSASTECRVARCIPLPPIRLSSSESSYTKHLMGDNNSLLSCTYQRALAIYIAIKRNINSHHHHHKIYWFSTHCFGTLNQRGLLSYHHDCWNVVIEIFVGWNTILPSFDRIDCFLLLYNELWREGVRFFSQSFCALIWCREFPAPITAMNK